MLNRAAYLDDFEASGCGRDTFAALMACGGDVKKLRQLAPVNIGALPDQAQRVVDQTVTQVALERLSVAADVMAEGLVYNLPNPMSVLEVHYEAESKSGYARRTMNPSGRGERHVPNRQYLRIPVYATIDTFSLGIRLIQASERVGQPIDVTAVAQATRRVNEAIEDAFINGAGVQVDGWTTPGLLNAPHANTGSVSKDWNDSGTVGGDMLADVISMIELSQAAHRYGPYNIYIGTKYNNAINNDFKTYGTVSIRDRIQELSSGGRNVQIRVADRVPDKTVILTQMTSDVLDMIVGQTPVVVGWEDGPGWHRNFAVIAFMIPRVRSDYNGQSGVTVFTHA